MLLLQDHKTLRQVHFKSSNESGLKIFDILFGPCQSWCRVRIFLHSRPVEWPGVGAGPLQWQVAHIRLVHAASSGLLGVAAHWPFGSSPLPHLPRCLSLADAETGGERGWEREGRKGSKSNSQRWEEMDTACNECVYRAVCERNANVCVTKQAERQK